MGFSRASTVADIGAGTGIFSLPLIEEGLEVYCVEPNEDMKKKMDEELSSYENYFGVCASAEHTTLPDKSIDYIVCAQAFHWFDRALFKRECQRILSHRKNYVVLIWNVRAENDYLNQEHHDINRQYCPSFKGFSGGMSDVNPSQFDDFFSDSTCNFKAFENNITFDSEDTFLGKCLTVSYAPKEADDNYRQYINALRSLYRKYADEQRLTIKNNSIIYWDTI